MVLSTGFKKIKTAVFLSGKGTNLKNLIIHSKFKNLPISIDLIISDNLKAYGLKYAKIFQIQKKIFDFKKKNYEKNLLNELKKNEIKLICLAGFMKILSKGFIQNFKGKIINIHPSLLPKYKGLNTHQRALKNNDQYSGCTVHYVNSKLDSGKIILQKKIKVYKNDTPKSLASKILVQEHKLYPAAIKKIFKY